ncbi:hypothetical protein [Mycolicibacterium sp. HS_4_1]
MSSTAHEHETAVVSGLRDVFATGGYAMAKSAKPDPGIISPRYSDLAVRIVRKVF